jgi:hypothetical protein
MMTVTELADRFERLRDTCAEAPPEPLTQHEEAVAASALSTLAGLLGSLRWRIAEAAAAAKEREAAAAQEANAQVETE